MSALDAIAVQTEIETGNVKPLLHEIRHALERLAAGGDGVVIDLRSLPLDQLKIDQSFVRDLLKDEASAAIVASTIALSRSLQLEVIAEGVETEAQRAWLTAHGCLTFQGYLFGRPGPVASLPFAD